MVDVHLAMQWLREEAERTVSKQRDNGLSEMNLKKLWETATAPTVRRLLKGDDVRQRSNFIEANALRAGKIDV